MDPKNEITQAQPQAQGSTLKNHLVLGTTIALGVAAGVVIGGSIDRRLANAKREDKVLAAAAGQKV